MNNHRTTHTALSQKCYIINIEDCLVNNNNRIPNICVCVCMYVQTQTLIDHLFYESVVVTLSDLKC